MLVNNHNNMLREAHRVTKSGAKSVFTIWGRRNMSYQFTSIVDVINRYRAPPLMNENNFNMWDDKGTQLKNDL